MMVRLLLTALVVTEPLLAQSPVRTAVRPTRPRVVVASYPDLEVRVVLDAWR